MKPLKRLREVVPLKLCSPLATTIQLNGEEYFILSYDASPQTAKPKALSAAEREIASFLLAGMTTAQIAEKRGASIRTVTTQIESIYRKLGIGSRAELAALLLPHHDDRSVLLCTWRISGGSLIVTTQSSRWVS